MQVFLIFARKMTSQKTRQENLLSDCINSLKLWKDMITTHLEGEEQLNELNQLEKVVKDFCLIEHEASKATDACEEVIEFFSNEDNNDEKVDIDELYKEKLRNNNNAFTNHQQHKIWKEVFIERTDHDVEEVTQTVNQTEQETEYEEMQDSIFYSNVFTPPVDPISKMVIQDPYKNRTCGHVYEYKFILQYIKSMKNKAKCPYIGCNNKNINVAELVQDSETKNKILNYQKTQQGSEDNDDD